MAAKEVYEQAKKQGISSRTLERAKKELHIVSYPLPVDGKNVWFWGQNIEDSHA
jgi:hypothetical protein